MLKGIVLNARDCREELRYCCLSPSEKVSLNTNPLTKNPGKRKMRAQWAPLATLSIDRALRLCVIIVLKVWNSSHSYALLHLYPYSSRYLLAGNHLLQPFRPFYFVAILPRCYHGKIGPLHTALHPDGSTVCPIFGSHACITYAKHRR